MKKILLGLFFAMFAFQVNAAILTLDNTVVPEAPGVLSISPFENNLESVAANGFTQAEVSFQHVWGIISDVDTIVTFTVDGLFNTDSDASRPVTGISLWNPTSAFIPVIEDTTASAGNKFSFSYLLTAGAQNFLVVDGFGSSSYQLTASAVPLPAAVWLFGSALMGLFGVSRRKSTAVAA